MWRHYEFRSERRAEYVETIWEKGEIFNTSVNLINEITWYENKTKKYNIENPVYNAGMSRLNRFVWSINLSWYVRCVRNIASY